MVAKESAKPDAVRSGANSPDLMKQDEYIGGAHDFWANFCWGLVFGGIVGLVVGWQLFDGDWAIAAMAVSMSVIFAYSCGRWGDRAWYWFIEFVGSWSGGSRWR